MVVTLEQAKIAEQQLTVSAGSNVELQSQVDILKGTIKLMQDQITVYQSMTDMAKQFSDTKDKLCQEQIKAATPTFMDNVKSNVLAGSIGAALAVVLMLLL